MHHTARRAEFTVRGNYFRFILSTHTVNSARHMLKKDSLCFVCITAHTIAAPVSPLSLLLRQCAFRHVQFLWERSGLAPKGGADRGLQRAARGLQRKRGIPSAQSDIPGSPPQNIFPADLLRFVGDRWPADALMQSASTPGAARLFPRHIAPGRRAQW